MGRLSDQAWKAYKATADRVEALEERAIELARPFASHSPALTAALARVDDRKAKEFPHPCAGETAYAEDVVHMSGELHEALDELGDAVAARGKLRREWLVALGAEKAQRQGDAAGVA